MSRISNSAYGSKHLPLHPNAEFDPFLIVLELKDTKGEPVRHTMIDTWQADGSGGYYFFTWTLRGKMMTDGEGRVELLTVRPGEYLNRASHNHLRVYPSDNAHRQMTTQMYICDGNDPVFMNQDSCVLPNGCTVVD